MTSAAYAAQLYITGFINQDLIKEIDWYDFMNDGTDPTSYETNQGIIRADYTAKPSFVTFNAAASELADAAYVDSYNTLDQNLRIYKFHRESDNKDIYVIWSNEGSETVSLNFGSDTVQVGDMFGNFSNYAAVNGAVTLNVTEQPVYIEGNFQTDPTLTAAAFSTDVPSVSATPGDDITIHVTRSQGAENLSGTYAVTLPAGWTLKSGDEFKAGSATDTLIVTSPENADPGTGAIRITPQDASGNHYATLTVSTTLMDPSVIEVQPEVNDDGTGYVLAVNIINKSSKLTLSGGDITILDPENMAGSRTFEDIKPNSLVKVTFPFASLSEYVPKDVKLEIKRMNESSKVITRTMTSLTAVKAETAPDIDGTYHPSEWENAQTFHINQNSQVEGIPDWTEDFLSAIGSVKWDNQYLYLNLNVTDPTHYNTYGASSNWMGDSVQFSIDPGRGQGYGVLPHTENNIALRSDTGDITSAGGFGAGGLAGSQIKATRDDSTNTTNYEMAISWANILPTGMEPSAGMDLGFSLLVNDNNGSGRLGWIEYMKGIGSSKDPTLYGDLILTDKASLNISNLATPTSILAVPASITINQGASQTAKATVYDEDNQAIPDASVTWSSADPDVATVDENGLITGVKTGSTTVTATCGNLSDEISVTVTATPVATLVVPDPASLLMAVGDTQKINTSVFDQSGKVFDNENIAFESSNPSVATVESDGTVTAISKGFTNIRIQTADLTAEVPVTVVGGGTEIHRVDWKTAPGSGRWIDYNSDNKYPYFSFSGGGWWSDSWAWMYTGVGSDPDHVDFTFTGNSIRVILSNLMIGGKANIYLDGNLEETVDTILNIPDFIQRDGTVYVNNDLEEGQHVVRVEVTGKYVDNTKDLINAFEYTTGDPIDTEPTATSVTVSVPSESVKAGETITASAVVKDQEGQPIPDAGVTWRSSDENIAAIDEKGVITAKKAGKVTITASNGDVSGNIDITVLDSNMPAQLAVPTGLAWDSATPGKAIWNKTENAVHYTVQLYKDGVAIGEPVSTDKTFYDFTGEITESGSYTFTVTAVGDGTNYTDSGISPESAVYPYTKPENPVLYTLKIAARTGGRINIGENGAYAAGTEISIKAVANNHYKFHQWTSSDGGTFANSKSASTTFIMPDHDVTVTADFIHTGNGNSENDGTGTVTVPPTEPEQTFLSDTTWNLSVINTYQFKITSKNGKAPDFVIGTPGVFEIKSVFQEGNDYFFKLRAIGAPGTQAGIYINKGPRLLIATVGVNQNYAKLDTGRELSVRAGKTYQFKVTAEQKPAFVSGNSSVFAVTYNGANGNDYFFQVTAVGKPGDCAGFYLNREKTPRTIGIIKE